MASTNQSPEYQQAEKKFLMAQTDDERLVCLEEMMRTAPKHKSSDSMRANLRTRYNKLKEKIETKKKSSKSSGKPGIKKQELQAGLIGLTNSGKSSVLSALTNARPLTSNYDFTTKYPIIGTLDYQNIKIQIVDLPAVESEFFDQGIANTADVLIIIITHIEDLDKISPFLEKAIGEKLIVYNKLDLLSENERRKVESRLRSNKLDYVLFSAKTKENINELNEKIFQKFGKIRIYTKQPKKPADKDPVVMDPGSTVKNVADKIFHGMSDNIKEARITGPSSKFSNQKVSLDHVLKDRDIVEFHLK